MLIDRLIPLPELEKKMWSLGSKSTQQAIKQAQEGVDINLGLYKPRLHKSMEVDCRCLLANWHKAAQRNVRRINNKYFKKYEIEALKLKLHPIVLGVVKKIFSDETIANFLACQYLVCCIPYAVILMDAMDREIFEDRVLTDFCSCNWNSK